MRRPINRRDFLVLSAMSAAACGGLCTVGAIAGTVLLRRAVATAVPSPTATPTPTPPTILPREAWGARPPNHEAEQEKGFATADNPLGWFVYDGDLSKI